MYGGSEKLRFIQAEAFIFEVVLRGRQVQHVSGIESVLKCLAAYPPHAFPRTERICRLARIANLTYSDASIRITALDAAVDYETLPSVELTDVKLREAYLNDTHQSGLEEGAPIILACRLRRCYLCDSRLPPPVDNYECTETCPSMAKENDVRIVTKNGPFACHEYPRTCDDKKCRAVHYSSHVVQFGKAAKAGLSKPILTAKAFDWRIVEVLRVHHNRFYCRDLLDSAVQNYAAAFLPFNTSSKTLVNASTDLQVPPRGDGVKDKTFVRACIMRALIFWRQLIAIPIGSEALANMKDVFESEKTLNEFLKQETRDDGFFNRGCLPMLHTHFALKHKHAHSLHSDGRGPGDDSFCQDGNFDATFKIVASPDDDGDESNESDDNSGESDDEDNSLESTDDSQSFTDDECASNDGSLSTRANRGIAMEVPNRSSGVTEIDSGERATAYTVMEKTDRDAKDEDLEDQLSHPFVRRKLLLTAEALADLKPGGMRIDANKLSSHLGYGGAKLPMLGIVARGVGAFTPKGPSQLKTDEGLDFKKWTVVFPHKDYKSDEASAIKSKEFHFGATAIRRFLVNNAEAPPADYVDWSDLPSFMAVEGGDSIEYPDGVIPEPVNVPVQEVEDAERRITKRCFTAGTAIACLAKENANPTKKGGRSNHVEGICFGCGWNVMLTSFHGGEGSVSNGNQYCTLILDHEELRLDMPIRWWQDNACNQLRHFLAELARWAMGLPCLNQYFNQMPWLLFMVLSLDVVVDRYHFRVGHVEKWCRCFLSPEERSPPEGTNTQAAEQQWVPLVRLTRSLNYMSPERFQFWALTHYMLTNIWRDRRTVEEQRRIDKKYSNGKRSVCFTEDGKPFLRSNKHSNRSHAIQKKRKKPKRNDKHQTKRRRVKAGTQRKQAALHVKSRVPITKAMLEALPHGCDERLLDKVDGRYRLTHIPHGIFKSNFSEGDNLKDMVLRYLGTEGEPTLEARFVVRAKLHRWMVDKVEEAWEKKHGGNALDILSQPGGFMIPNTCCGGAGCLNGGPS